MKLHAIIPGKVYQRGLVDMSQDNQQRRTEQVLRERNIGTIVCCVRKHNETLSAWCRENEVLYVYAPFADGNEVPAWLPSLAEEVAERAQERPVVIHCRAGRNRSGLLSALVVRQLLKIDGREALQHVQLTRPRAIANEAFAEYLRRLPAP